MSIRVHWWLRLLLVTAITGQAAAATVSKGDDAARDAALQWLQVVDSGNYQDAALMVSEHVRVIRDWPNYLSSNRARLGPANRREIVEVKHRSTIPEAAEVRRYVIIRFKTSFERPPSSTYGVASTPAVFEEVVTAKVGCCWEIFDYKIDEK